MGEILSGQGGVYWLSGDNSTALKRAYEALEIQTRLGNLHGMSACYNIIGNVYTTLQNPTKQLEYILKRVALVKKWAMKKD
ncbi:MAG: hypothetical protein LH606_11995 [Cytophagaceae bacterium]|nr:hypothetical protein [Cytophagaceae bacterium]